MKQVREIVDKMYAAFSTQNVDAVVNIFADNAELIYHGTKIMPVVRFIGKEGARMFFEFN